MPSSYIQSVPPTDIQKLFDRLVHQLPGSTERSTLADIYTSEFGDPSLGAYSPPQIRDHLQLQPIHFFALVSLLLSNPPLFLNTEEIRERLAQALIIPISDFEQVRVTSAGIWVRELDLSPLTLASINRYEYYPGANTSDITPTPIYNYLKSAVICFRSDLFPAALALAAIAFEACLREVLTGIKRNSLGQSPAYKRSTARVNAHFDASRGEPVLSFDVLNSVQSIREFFKLQAPKGSHQFLGRINFEICREDLPTTLPDSTSVRKIPLRLFVDSGHVDLLSTDQREPFAGQRPAQRFSEFIEAARLAGRLRARRLPLNSAEVIREVRNNLVHWSEDVLSKNLNTGITIKDYIEGADTVRTTISDVVNYISEEYYDLRLFERTGKI